MRYSTLASTVLLAVATAPALAHPITNRATEDASMVERELQDALMERGYYYDLLSRDLEARKTAEDAPPKPHAASVQSQRDQENHRLLREAHANLQIPRPGGPWSGPPPGPSHPPHPPHPNGGSGPPVVRGRTAAPGTGREASTIAGSMTSTASCSGAASR
ncbi:uncharacterized protein B0H18DRAFT_503809 [Fomitopsis serialis]|uniref:uncharacterized protein n=1 Tax=Fomitopsis serialis TaxID=139415 RepID=UPI0020085996|nr:uncharacterized protein B0H18DRAFT_503809 [Neoantrodia serialis]KAH9922764.1 hypothetical protein B0H18DRAFT_503809 [Neoantrodia serialis]